MNITARRMPRRVPRRPITMGHAALRAAQFTAHPDGLRLAIEPHIVPADALVVLSRTNLRTITRVLVAIDALRAFYGDAAMPAMLDPMRVPSEGVGIHHDLSSDGKAPTPEKQDRADAVEALLEAMQRDPELAAHLALLGHR